MTTSSLKQLLARRLEALMAPHPVFNTNERVARRAGVSMNTVRRIRTADDSDASIENVAAVAKVFGLTLAEFIGDDEAAFEARLPGSATTPAEQVLAQLARLPEERILALGVALGIVT